MSETVTVTIDGKELTVPKGTLVIRAAEQIGITIPRFCDHPLLDPVGACRQCMVEVEGQRKPFTACTTTCTEGMVCKTHFTSDVAAQAQQGQLEFLLINHPLDCPQCDKGGECPLQDQTLVHGPPDTRLVDRKRRYEKPIPISELVALDRERCVLCARCTRFSQQISGDAFIELFERGALEQVAIYADEPYHSYFSGNIVQICPVGALTASPYRFKARPFDLRTTPGVCNHCSAGCNLRVDTRRGVVERQLARTNMATNEMWSCDKGRFGYPFVHHPDRLRTPLARPDIGGLEPVTWAAAVRRAAEGFAEALEANGPEGVGVLTGGRLTDEDAYAAGRFARDVLGTDNVDFRLWPRTDDERDVLAAVAGTTGPTYEEVEDADVVVIAGLDTEEEVPILHLRLRKAWRTQRQRIVVVGPVLGSLEEIAWRWIPTAPGEEGLALAGLAGGALEGAGDVIEALGGGGDAERQSASAGTPRTVVLAGERLGRSPGALPAAAHLASAVDGSFAWVPRRAGARGAVDAGLVPGLLPGGRTLDDPGPVADAWHRLPQAPGKDARALLEAAAEGELGALLLVGVDPARDFEDPGLARRALERVGFCVVADLLPTASSRYADVVFPACAPQERVGSFTTWEGRRQPFQRAVPAQGLVQEDWDILRQIARAMDVDLRWETAADVRAEAAPLMESPQPARGALGTLGKPALPAPAAHDDDRFGALVLDHLLAPGGMLVGAAELAETARAEAVWVNETDARRLGVDDGARVSVTGPGGMLELPARVTGAVTPGCVVLPGSSATVPGTGLVDGWGAPLTVTLAPAQGEGG